MADETPATADTSAATDAGAGGDLLENPAAAEAGASADGAAPADAKGEEKPATASKPEAKAEGEGGEKAEGDKPEADLLADDDEGKSPDEEADGQADAKKGGAPETYEAFTAPEGVTIDEAAVATVTPVFKELNLTQEQAQSLVSKYAELQQAAAEQQVANFNQVKKDWVAELKSDPEFGGDKFDQTVGAAKAVIGKYGDKALFNELKEWGWANNPRLIKLLARVNAHLSEDQTEHGDPAAQAKPRSAAQTLYPNMPGDNP